MQTLNDFFSAHLPQPTVVTIGSFDGVHRGHQTLIRVVQARARERGAASVVITLHPHPKRVLGRDPDLPLLTTLDERLELLDALGVDAAVILPFSVETARVTAEEFVERLVRELGMVEIVCTADFAFGYKRGGNLEFLTEAGRRLGFQVTVVEPGTYEGEKISSSRIRGLIERGDVSLAACLLGREPSVRGIVVPGDHRGRGMGFPTANLALPEGKIIPANGIYAVRVRLPSLPDTAGMWFASATSIGVRPTFLDGGRRLVEVHILDFDRDIYGQAVEAHFVKRLRDEQKFASVQALIAQMNRDCENARQVLSAAHQLK